MFTFKYVLNVFLCQYYITSVNNDNTQYKSYYVTSNNVLHIKLFCAHIMHKFAESIEMLN